MNNLVRVFFVFIILGLWVGASTLNPENISQKEIRTMQDFIALEKALKQAATIDPKSAKYYLGLLYLSTHVLDNGKSIKPDYDKALTFLEESLNDGNILAAYNMAMIFLQRKEIDQSIFVLQITLQSLNPSTKTDISSGAYLSAALASIVLDFRPDNKEAISLAIKYLEKYLLMREMPSAQYLLSQLFLKKGDMNSANMYLTRACKSHKLPLEIKEICLSLKAK